MNQKRNKIVLLFVILFFSVRIVFCQSELEMIKIPFHIKSSGKTVLIYSTGNKLTFFKETEKVAEHEFYYYPFNLSFPKKCDEYFKNSFADSLEMTFYARGLFGKEYEYRIGLNRFVNFLNSTDEDFFELEIEDLFFKGRNKSYIKKLGIPFIYSFFKKNTRTQDSYFNREEIQQIKLLRFSKKYRKIKEERILEYDNYRYNFYH